MALLELNGITTEYETLRSGTARTLDNISLAVDAGEVVGVVGETGAGKSVLVRAIMGVLKEDERLVSGAALLEGNELPIANDRAMEPYRGAKIALIDSGARARLDPVQRIGSQLLTVMRAHRKVAKDEGLDRAESLIRSVGIPDAKHQLQAYPHELSGGMCQRVVIAMALANSPRLLIADEPTAGLDVTIQIQILDLFKQLVEETGAASLLVTRDLANVAHYCDRILVLRNGELVEEGPVSTFFKTPETEYSQYLLRMSRAARGEFESAGGGAQRTSGVTVREAATPSDGQTDDDTPLLEVRDLVKHFKTERHTVHAVNQVSLSVRAGETLALVGESGSGKTTVGRCIVGLLKPTDGAILLDGTELAEIEKAEQNGRGLDSHLVFQEPRESLDPRWTLGRSVEEPLLYHSTLDKRERTARMGDLLDLVHLPSDHAQLYPHQVTAGEQQRIAIARSIAANPKLVVLDEPTSALDPSVRARTIELLVELQEELGIAYLFISHDMTAVKMIAHRIAVMYLGRLMEVGPAAELFDSQVNPYGRALLSSVLYPDPEQVTGEFRLEGEIPSAIDLVPGCPLSGRCPLAIARCAEDPPELEAVSGLDRWSACFRTDEILSAGSPDDLLRAEWQPVETGRES